MTLVFTTEPEIYDPQSQGGYLVLDTRDTVDRDGLLLVFADGSTHLARNIGTYEERVLWHTDLRLCDLIPIPGRFHLDGPTLLSKNSQQLERVITTSPNTARRIMEAVFPDFIIPQQATLTRQYFRVTDDPVAALAWE